MSLFKPITLFDLLFQAEKFLKQLLNIEQARVVKVQNQKVLIALENGDVKQLDGVYGILGKCIQEKRTIIVSGCYEHHDYSPEMDLSTRLPVICFPVMDYEKLVYGAF